jgi:D-alanine transaminase/branched-chain amino acid aminotransferase
MAAYFNNRFINNEEATLHVSDLSMQRAYAVFDFFRTGKGIPLFIDNHIERFYASAAAMHLPVKQSRDELKQIVYELIKQSSLAEAGIRIMLTGGYAADTYHIAKPNLVITCNPVKTATKADFEKGITAITYNYQRELPHIKSIHYLMAVWLHPLLKEKGADDVLYHSYGMITEFPRANVFVITKEGQLLTPARNILHGITRKNVLQLAAATMHAEERDITIDELCNAAEAFLTSTTRRIIPVVKIDDMIVGDGKPGKMTGELYERLVERENQQCSGR